MSKKIKGKKMDISEFMAAAPPPPVNTSSDARNTGRQDRAPYNGGGDGGNDFRGNDRRGNNNGGYPEENRDDTDAAPWSRVRGSGERTDRNLQPDNSQAQADNNWRKSSAPTPNSSTRAAFDGNRFSGSSASGSGDTGYKKLNIAPKSTTEQSLPPPPVESSVTPSATSTEPAVTENAPVTDKWANVFGSTSSTSRRQPSDNFRETDRDNRGGERRSFGGRSSGGNWGGGGGDRDGDRGEGGNFGGGGYRTGGGGGGGGGGGYRRSNPSDEIDDPRFAGKFGSGGDRPERGGYRDRGERGDRGDRGGDRGDSYKDRSDRPGYRGGGGGGGGGGYRDRDRPQISPDAPLPSAPRAVRGATTEQQLPAHLQKLTVEASKEAAAAVSSEQKGSEDAKSTTKAAKAAKVQAREETERRNREAKEAAAALVKEQAELRGTLEKNALTIVEDFVKSGSRGVALRDKLQESKVEGASSEEDSPGLLGTALLKYALTSSSSPEDAVFSPSKWWAKDQFGAALSGLLEGRVPAQVTALFIVQAYCHSFKFPVITGAKSGKLIELLFNLLLSSQAIEPEGFFAWSEDETEDSPGRLDAAVQTSGFIMKLRELLQDDEEEEEEEVDRPREIVK